MWAGHLAGLYPLGNLVAPKNLGPQIRIIRTRNDQDSGTTTDKNMVDRAGFEPATFRILDLEFAKRTIFGPVGIPD